MKIIYSFSILIIISLGFSQEDVGGTPYSLNNTLSRITPTITLPAVDTDALIEEDLNRPTGTPYRYGLRIPGNYSSSNNGIWETLMDGTKIWRLNINSQYAYALSIVFDSFYLPEGSKLYIFNSDYSIIYGAYTELNNNPNEVFATPLLMGDELIIEYSESVDAAQEHKLHIDYIIHDYRDIMNYNGVRDRNCGINVVCPEADPFEDQINAAAFLDMGGYICSGSMLNNTSQDLTPYFLTADHCVEGENTGTFKFYFNYDTNSCGGGSASYGSYAYGSITRARSYDMDPDFALLEITGSVYESWGVYYAGWNRSSSAPQISCGVHHPGGDPKKINFDDDYATNSPGINWEGGDYTPPGSHWKIIWDEGGTEGGSSGSPAYDDEGRVIGQLTGGSGDCINGTDYYGKLQRGWDGSSSSTRLKDWLDPNNTGVTYIDGTYNGYSPELTVVTPNGNENIETGSAFGIEWDDNLTENVSIKLYNNGSFISTVVSSTSSDGFYNWSVSETLSEGNNYTIKITSVSDPSIYDYSDGNFSISEPLSDVSIDLGDINPGNGTIDIVLTNSSTISGYQFEIVDFPDYIDLTDAFGGATEENNFLISTAPNGIVVAFSMTGTVIPPGTALLTQLSYVLNDNCNECENFTLCIENPIFSNEEGLPYPVIIGDCINVEIMSLLPGDINSDGVVNVLDIVLLINEILYSGGFTDTQIAVSDLNDDGELNILDVVLMVNLILAD